RRGAYAVGAGRGGTATQRKNLRVARSGMPARAGALVGRGARPAAARYRSARHRHAEEQGMFACLYGPGDLTRGDLAAIAFEFSPLVEQTAPDTVTFDVSGLDRLFGLPQDIAAAIARRAPACRPALAANSDVRIRPGP